MSRWKWQPEMDSQAPRSAAPFEHDGRTASASGRTPCGGQPQGKPWTRPRTRGSCPTIPAAWGRGSPRGRRWKSLGAAPAGGSPGVRLRTRGSCPTTPAARGRGSPRPAVESGTLVLSAPPPAAAARAGRRGRRPTGWTPTQAAVDRRQPRGSSRIDRPRPSELDRSSAAPARVRLRAPRLPVRPGAVAPSAPARARSGPRRRDPSCTLPPSVGSRPRAAELVAAAPEATGTNGHAGRFTSAPRPTPTGIATPPSSVDPNAEETGSRACPRTALYGFNTGCQCWPRALLGSRVRRTVTSLTKV